MRIARYEQDGSVKIGFFEDSNIVALADAAAACAGDFGRSEHLRKSADMLDFLPPDGPACSQAIALGAAVSRLKESEREKLAVPTDHLRLLVPIPRPNAIYLLIFPVAALIAFISSFVTLEPGDIISTGTPSGVGAATGTFLKSGDVLEAEISGIGLLRNPVM